MTQPNPYAPKVGDEFIHIPPDEFGAINKRANALGLMALIFEIERDDGENCVSVSFEIVRD